MLSRSTNCKFPIPKKFAADVPEIQTGKGANLFSSRAFVYKSYIVDYHLAFI